MEHYQVQKCKNFGAARHFFLLMSLTDGLRRLPYACAAYKGGSHLNIPKKGGMPLEGGVGPLFKEGGVV